MLVDGEQPKHLGRAGTRWNRAVTQLKRESAPVCWLCGRDIDMTLDPRHPMSWTADHIEPLSKRPDLAYEPSNLRPAHRRCNSIKSDGVAAIPLKSSRRW